MTDPENCPFCGCMASILIDAIQYEFNKYKIICRNKECLMQSAYYNDQELAVYNWNKRV